MTVDERISTPVDLRCYVVFLTDKRPRFNWHGLKGKVNEVNKILYPEKDLMKEFVTEAGKVGSVLAWKLVKFENRYRINLLRKPEAISEIRRLKEEWKSKGHELVFVTKSSITFCPFPIVLDDLIHSSIGDQ